MVAVNHLEKTNTMAITINDMYRSAAMGEISWEQALLLTGLLYVDAAGLVVSPPPENEVDYRFYKLRFDLLYEHQNNNYQYKNVINTLNSYLISYQN